MASLHPESLRVIPRNISCASYTAVLTGFLQSLKSLPPIISQGVISSAESLKETFTRCLVPVSLTCEKSPVDENLICAGVDGSQLANVISNNSSSTVLCSFTIVEHACSSATNLTHSNLATLMKCALESQTTYPVEVWKLFFQKASPAVDQALETFATTAPNISSKTMSHALEALGELRIASFNQSQLQDENFIRSWFQTKMRPFLASPSSNFLICLSSNNFSCQTYQIVIQAFSSQRAFMDRDGRQEVFTHFIKPFLSRNDSSDPGCVSSTRDSKEWLRANFGNFSDFAKLQDLQALNPKFSSVELLSELTPSQVAQLILSSGALNDTDLIDGVFDRLEDGNALENMDQFLTQLTANETVPDFQPVVRDHMMNRTFIIISPYFSGFNKDDFYDWFHVKLVLILASFSPTMFKNATSEINCTNYHIVVRGMGKVFNAMPSHRQQGIADAMLGYLRKSASVINTPVCRQGIANNASWLEANLGPFSQYTTYSVLKHFNISGVAAVDSLSPQQKAELILDPDSGALENETTIRVVFTSLTQSGDEEQLNQFFQGFTNIIKQENITYIKNPRVRDTILNLTLTALAPDFEDFEPEDFQLWFQVYLVPVMASLHPESLRVIPRNISCASYTAVLTGLLQSLKSLPPIISQGVISSAESLKETFTRCLVPVSLTCEKSPVDENLICAGVDGSQLANVISNNSSSTVLCSFTITEHACSSATNLTHSNLATLMKCALESQTTYPVEVWKLFFQKASPALDQALETFATTAPNISSKTMSHALEALGELRIASFNQSQLQDENFIRSWFQTKMRPFLASPSSNFLICLSSNNFSCQTYQIVIQAFSSQRAFMDRDGRQAVFTHFIKPFLSRNDSSDPGCVSSTRDSKEWLRANFGNFSDFAKLQDLQALNPKFSSVELLSELTPSQVAQLILSSGALNDTDLIDGVFDRLEDGNALENMDQFLTQLTANETVPDFQPAVRDHMMNRTFIIISPYFSGFNKDDFYDWFHVKLVLILASFSPTMFKNATSEINCTNYHIVVRGMGKVFNAMPSHRQQGIADAMLGYLRKSASVINTPVCRQGIANNASWLEANLGPFSQYTTYSVLKHFNISGVAAVDSLSPQQKAELILDPDSGALENETTIRVVFTSLTQSGDEEQLNQFFQGFTNIIKQENITYIKNPRVRDTILNLTLTALAPDFEDFEPEDFQLWFQVYLVPVMASLHPESLRVIPRNISCASYTAVLTGLLQSLKSLPPIISQGVISSAESLKETFTRCLVPVSLTCEKSPVDENLICAGVDGSQLANVISNNSSSTVLCSFTITEHACSSATNLTHSNLATLMKCALESQTTYPVEVWKLFFQKASPALDQALETFAATAPNISSKTMSHALEALGELRIASFNQSQLQDENFIRSWFQTKMRPFLASPSSNFLICLSSNNFSCQTYQIVIQAFSSQRAFMDRDGRQAVFTHFIKPFLSRNDSSDPGCVSSTRDSKEWLRANFGNFSDFAKLQDLQALNPKFSSVELLSELTPSQVAQLILSSGALNDTDLIDGVFDRLEDGNALENMDQFLTQLTANETVPDFQPAVRDHMMNRTFIIISPYFSGFNKDDFYDWFHVKLVLILASFSPTMFKNATSEINCTNYHIVVRGMGKVFNAMPSHRQQGIADAMLGYLRKSASVINTPVCRQGIANNASWLEANLGPFSQYTTYSVLKHFNISGVAAVDSLSPQQKAELILDPDSGALENETTIRVVFTSLTQSGDEEQLNQFFQGFTNIIKQENITYIKNPRVRDTILNLTLTALAPDFEDFEPEDFQLWFQVYLVPVMASLHPESLRVIPRNISCASYTAVLTGLLQSLKSLPPIISQGVISSAESLKETFTRCLVPVSLTCEKSPVDENLICAGVDGSQLANVISNNSSSTVLCSFTITEHACSSATNLTHSNLATLMKCALESQTTYPVEVWKLFFQKASPALDQALETFATTAPNISSKTMSHALEALGELRIASFNQSQLQDENFIRSWFQTKMRPFLASPSSNFLICLSSNNFSCQTYQIVIQAFSSQRAFMDRDGRQAVFTHFIKPFLSRNDSSDPGCVSSTRDSKEWLRANFGNFSDFAKLQDLQALNPKFSSVELLSELTPSQVAQLILSSGALNDTDLIDGVFDRLEDGNALENMDQFLTQLTANETVPDFQPAVRDHMMNRTFIIISPYFSGFNKDDFYDWFHVKLVLILASFSPTMFKNATSEINCTNYHIVVRGMGKVFNAMPSHRQQGIADAMLGYLRKSASVINTPVCRQGIANNASWLEANLGPFSQYTTYSVLKHFNISGVAAVDSLSPQQKAELILDPDSGALENETTIRVVFTSLTQSGDEEQLNQFFQGFTNIIKQENITYIKNPRVRDTILNLTLTALAPDFEDFEPEDFQLWFQVYLVPVMASLHPESLRVIPRNISCASYTAVLTGLLQSLKSLPPIISQGVISSAESLKETFTRCLVPVSLTCEKSPVDENLICAGVDGSQLANVISNNSSSTVLCSFTITEHACSSATNLTHSNLATLMKCALESQTTYPVEVWKLFFQKASPALDQALETFATTAPNISSKTMSHALEALGELRIASFNQSQLQDENFIRSWFQTKMRPFLASPSSNFLICLSSNNFSCQTYQIVIQAFSSQRAFMDRDGRQAVFTHFIKPFLSRNDSSDPGCVSSTRDSKEWLRANFGNFSDFAKLQDLQALNPKFSSVELLSELTPSQVAQLILSSGALNDTDLIDGVFDRLEDGNALENMDQFLTQLTANETVPDFQPAVRDHMMNRTFIIISPYFSGFNKDDFYDWFHVKLVLILASFSPTMFKNATSEINCTNYHIVVRGMGKVFNAMPSHRQQGIADAMLGYLRKSASVINTPVCRQGIANNASWLEANLGPFSQYTTYSVLKHFNISGVAAVDSLSPQQKAELILDPDSGALENETTIRVVFTSLTQSGDEEQLNQFFQGFTNIIKQENITYIKNPRVRDTILNLTLTALAPDFEDFEPEDFQLWFQVYLVPVMASLHPESLRVIPRNISCASYTAVLTGLLQSLKSLPPIISQGVISSAESLKETFTRCLVPVSLTCEKSPVDENLICAGVDGSQLANVISNNSSSTVLCSFTITEHACSSATNLTHSNLATLMKCALESQTTYPVEVWKLFFQKASPALDQALETFATTAPNISSKTMSHALEALGELRIASFNQSQLQDENFIRSWFQTKMRPFLASPSSNFLICLSSNNFSCQTYQIVIQAFSSQRAFMDRDGRQAVFTHFIKPFLSRNDSSDPGCVSSTRDSKEWLRANFGNFSDFAKLQDLQALNPKFSSVELLSELTPSQVAQLILSSGALNDTDLIDGVFDRLEDGNALENMDQFLTQLTANETVPDFQPAVRDHMMNRTFIIISPYFSGFNKDDFYDWFHVKLVLILASFSPTMFKNATSEINCTNYHIVVRGMGKVFNAMPSHRQQGIADAMLGYLRKSASVINTPVCRQGIANNASWLEANLGPFSQYTTYSVLKHFNISGVAAVDSLSPQQKAELILDPDSGALENETTIRVVFTSLTQSGDEEQLNQFFQGFTNIIKQENITYIKNPRVRDTILNLTLTALAPDFEDFEPEDFQLWFQVYLVPVMASLHPESLRVIPRNISCASYTAVLTGLLQSLKSLPPIISQGVISSAESLKETFTRCLVPVSLTCEKSPVDENLICAGVDGSQLANVISNNSSSTVLCSFTITEHACSSATNLTHSNLATLMKCALESQTTYPVEVWKLFFQKASPALDQALETFATTAPNISSKTMSHALEALGELRIASFNQSQLQDENFIRSWFQTKMRPFLASPSSNFLICLSSNNFSCQTYQIVIQAFSSQRAFMDRDGRQAVFTHFIKPFLSRNDSSDPGCVSSTRDSKEWLRANFGNFSDFAKLQDLQALNPKFSSVELLSELTPSQVAQLILSSGALNDTDLIDGVFDRLEDGNALENMDQFLTQLTANETVPDFQPAVRDHMMNRTFIIISPYFSGFNKDDFYDWFHVKLVLILASFSPTMFKNATSEINCTNYHIVVRGMGKVFNAMPSHRQQGIADAMLGYLRKSASVINTPVCRQGIANNASWLEANLGPFSQYTTYSVLKHFNISGVAAVDSLSPQQKAELILDPDSGALENETTIRVVFTSLTQSGDEEQLNQFFQGFTNIIKQENITYIKNPRVRDTILNLTLTALAPDFEDFEPEDFQLWFQVYLVPVMASLHPESLRVIPRNISCASYTAVLTGLLQSLKSLPPIISQGVISSAESLKETFTRCLVPVSLTCEKSPVDENLICAGVDGSQLANVISNNSSSTVLCSFTITEHACSSATNLTHSNLATLMKCALESQTTYPVEVWKLFFQKASPALDQALETFATTAPNISSKTMSHALEALGELRIASFNQSQLQDENFIRSWFQTKMRPFLASPSSNFLICLSSNNFSCQTYQIVIQAFSSQRAFMDRDGRQAVFTHFIKPFLSRNDSSDPGCVSSTRDSKEWLRANFGNFSDFAKLQDLQALNPKFSSVELLSELTPSQVAQLILSSGALNDTDLIDGVFDRLEDGNALENMDQFLTQLTANETVPDFQPAVRDHMMNRTFIIISPYFSGFNKDDFYDWFHVKLVLILASFSPTMFKNATSEINCTNYHIVVRGMGKVFNAMPSHRQQGIADAMLGYLRKSASVINTPVCRQGIANNASWLEANLGPFSQYTTYSVLKHFNISGVAAVDSLSPQQKAELILDPDSGALENETTIRVVFTSLTQSGDEEQLNQFFQGFTNIIKQENITYIKNPRVRDTILNLTLTALAPDFEDFEPEDFQLWFQVYLVPVMASLHPESLRVIPRNISCASYTAVLTGLLQSLKSLPPIISQGVISSAESLKETFTL
ncbi:uncharacterized protein LOC114427786 [Parambassis ranga]|uniref:Uncharacterized protein LOC114427786 n=1 Tax=Parambassis ranga TaxID=210632 RepID=A0A6P7HT68_9TELE|nr:uncharacterized protein LOC114427786 [Parambassis ranga]